MKVAEICRQAGICEQISYRRQSKFGGMGASEIQRLKALEDENRRLKQLIEDAMLDQHVCSSSPKKPVKLAYLTCPLLGAHSNSTSS